MNENYKELYSKIEKYAKADGDLFSLAAVLPFVYQVLGSPAGSESLKKRYADELCHAMQVCVLLIDIRCRLDSDDLDRLLSAVLLHPCQENFGGENLMKMTEDLGLRQEIHELLEIITVDDDAYEEEVYQYYQRVQENKLALLAVLAERGNRLQHLHRFSIWNAHRYIEETKIGYLPMGIYGKEHYHELLAPINILMEKMKTLIEVSEILIRRYEVREAELMQDIMAIREDIASIKGIIKKFREEKGL